MEVFKRQGKLFVINESVLPTKAKTPQIKLALYGAVYEEFAGAIYNPKYENLNAIQKMDALNNYAEKWLKDRDLL